jgi:hypothetical protein
MSASCIATLDGFGWFGSGGHWIPVRDGDPRLRALYERHYSCRKRRGGHRFLKTAGPGEYMALLAADARAAFVWRKYIDRSGQTGVCCALFRNEGPVLSSELIREARQHAWRRWPGARLYTYVNPARIKSSNPGYCFLKAGWRRCGRTRGGLVILECLPGWLAG